MRGVFQEKKVMMEKHQLTNFARYKRYNGKLCFCVCPETFKLMNIFQALPIGTASVG